jgi:c-di-GMP-related signal transduction protein
LSYRVLRALNSAATPLRVEIASIRQAIILLGRDTIRRWASLWTIAAMNESAHPELVASSIIRGRCCEMIDASSNNDPGNGFLLGMCSLLDVILEQPMETVLAQLPIDKTVRGALLGEQNERRLLLDGVIAYERGDWDRYDMLAALAGTSSNVLRAAYCDALRWTRDLTASAA